MIVSRLRAAGIIGTFSLVLSCGGRTALDGFIGERDEAGAKGRTDSGLICPDGGLPVAYLLDTTGALYTLNPATLKSTPLGTPRCGTPHTRDTGPWTISVTQTGTAYVVYKDWSLYAVDLRTLTCATTSFRAGQLDLQDNFGIAVSRTVGTELLYVYGQPNDDGAPILAAMDLVSFVLSEVAPIVPVPPTSSGGAYDVQADLAGNIFAYTPDGFLVEVDSATGIASEELSTGFPPEPRGSFAIMTYQDDVYLFAGTEVARYNLTTHHATTLGTVTVAGYVVGASAAPCFGAP